MPDPALWSMDFADGTRDQWAQRSATAMWNRNNDSVLYADGIRTADEMRLHGRSQVDWLQQTRIPLIDYEALLAGG